MVWGLLCLILLLPLVFLSYGLHDEIETTNYTIKSIKIKKPVMLAVITDLHSCDYGENGKALLQMLDAIHPDIVLLAGDIIDDHMPWENGLANIQGITDKFPCYYVSGNHEYKSGNIQGIKAELRARNVAVLEGETLKAQVNGQVIQMSGIDDALIGKTKMALQLKAASAFDERYYTVFMAHRPELIQQYLPYGYDLIVCGHAHGGQVRVPFLAPQGLYAPNQGIFPRYTGGFWKMGGTDFVVSRGLSKKNIRIPRLYNCCELVAVRLMPAD